MVPNQHIVAHDVQGRRYDTSEDGEAPARPSSSDSAGRWSVGRFLIAMVGWFAVEGLKDAQCMEDAVVNGRVEL